MEQNKFEKQVQQKMDELKIHPADSVWEKIEARIEKKKHSKRELFLFLLFFIFLAGGYFLWNRPYRSITETDGPGKNSSQKNSSKISAENNKAVQPETNLSPGSIAPPRNATGHAGVKKNVDKNLSQSYKPANTKINSGEKSAIVAFRQKEVTHDVSEGIKAEIIGQQSQENETNREELKDSTYLKTMPDILPNAILKDANAKVKDTLKQTHTRSVATTHPKKTKWELGILLSGGISKVGSSFLNGDKSANVSDPNLSSGSPGPPPFPGIVPQPSATKAGFGFMIGTFVERNIFSNTKLVLGINFKSFSTTNKVGFRNTTNRLYNVQSNIASTSDTYTNRYNFIELPVTLKVQIGKGKNVPLFWQGGVVISELISSNALQFDQSSIYYYNDNSIFNKSQFGLNTSISVAVFSKRKHSFLIGPYFYYDASRLANEGLYNKKHFVFTGLRTEIIFGK